ncbi:hypothetical protein BV898_10697 [Hypsibius exemplaris]|uniref:Uncharacterized protein n=1 Tax=Hypsibius exemplaris TaxID=2072580 RepID=A0A1W0WIM0_HYPEX|nr:hypothetical protein BV898_10697 [Hypsibius exemplaris]
MLARHEIAHSAGARREQRYLTAGRQKTRIVLRRRSQRWPDHFGCTLIPDSPPRRLALLQLGQCKGMTYSTGGTRCPSLVETAAFCADEGDKKK